MDQGDVVPDQLDHVARQNTLGGLRMGERYDTDHVYYIDGKALHDSPFNSSRGFSWHAQMVNVVCHNNQTGGVAP